MHKANKDGSELIPGVPVINAKGFSDKSAKGSKEGNDKTSKDNVDDNIKRKQKNIKK